MAENFDEQTIERVLDAVADLGDVELSSTELKEDRSEWTEEIHRVFEAVDETLGLSEQWRAWGNAVRRIVITHLVPLIEERGVQVVVSQWYNTPAKAVSVNGLYYNQQELPNVHVSVDPAQVAAAYLAELRGDEMPRPTPSDRPSTLESMLQALVGRSVEVTVSANLEENVAGYLAAVHDDSVVLVHTNIGGAELVIVVPRSSVRWISSGQLTDDEFELLDNE